MQIWVGEKPLLTFPEGCVVTIGNFDGVHLGHKHILERLTQEAKNRDVPSVLITFEPSPREYFANLGKIPIFPQRITGQSDKLKLLEETGFIDIVWVIPFNRDFALLSAQEFIDDILVAKLKTQYLLIGDDFCFGSDRQGNFDLLKQQAKFKTEAIDSILVEGKRASSSNIREILQTGNFEQAFSIMGHSFFISGTVIEGKKLARQLGYPTANIRIEKVVYPLNGVFAVKVAGKFGCKDGVANLGLNPTVSESTEQKLEVHIFDYNDDIYGEEITVYFLKKIRDEIKFPDIAHLKKQIEQDGRDAQDYLLGLKHD